MKEYITKAQQAFSEKNTSVSQCLLITLSLLIILALFLMSIHLKMHLSTTESLHLYVAKYAAAAISSLEHNLNGFVGYNNIFDVLMKKGFVDDSSLQAAVSIKDFSSGGIYKIVAMDLGYATFAKWAFLLFGYKVSSFLFFYFLLLIVSVLVYVAEFKESKPAMTFLILFLLSYFLVSLKSVDMEYNVGVIYGIRFMSLLSLLPTIHLMLLVFLKPNKPTLKSIVLMAMQAIIILFIYYIRLSTKWIIISLLFVLVANLFIHLKPFHLKNYFKSSLPILIFFVFYVFSKFLMSYSENEIYKKEKEGAHVFWHSLYVGFALHPEIRKEYTMERPPASGSKDSWNERSLYRPNDQDANSAAFNWLYRHGKDEFTILRFKKTDNVEYRQNFTLLRDTPVPTPAGGYLRKLDMEKDYNWEVHEEIIKEVVFDVLKKYPLQVAQAIFIIKPLKFINIYITDFIKLKNITPLKSFFRNFLQADKLIIIVMLFLLNFFMKNSQIQLNSLIMILSFIFVFSLIIPFVVYPEPWNMADQSVLLTSMIYLSALKGLKYVSDKIYSHNFKIFKTNEIGQKNAN